MKVFQDNGVIPLDLFDKVTNEIGYILLPNYLSLIKDHDGSYLNDNTFDFVNIYVNKMNGRLSFIVILKKI